MARSILIRLRNFPVAVLLLPAFLFRALIPGGFMPAVDADGRLVLQLCPGYLSTPHGVYEHAASVHGHVHPESSTAVPHQGYGGSGGTHHEQQNVCPFSVSAHPYWAPAIFLFTGAVVQAVVEPATDVEQPHVPAIVRPQVPRAPPHPA